MAGCGGNASGYTADPDGPGPVPAFAVPNRDFSYRSLIGNAVLRWEWREGSTIFLVWQQRRIDSMTNRGPDGADPWVGSFDLSRDAADMFGAPADDIFAIKVNYWPGNGGAVQTLTKVDNQGACSGNAFYFDDNANPTKVFLCPNSCTTVQADTKAKLQLDFGCLGS